MVQPAPTKVLNKVRRWFNERRQELNEHDRLANHVAKLVDACEQYSDEQKPARDRALEYYNGEMSDLAAEEAVQRLFQGCAFGYQETDAVDHAHASSNDKIVDYEPVGPEDEEGSEQATDYVNHVVVPESGANSQSTMLFSTPCW